MLSPEYVSRVICFQLCFDEINVGNDRVHICLESTRNAHRTQTILRNKTDDHKVHNRLLIESKTRTENKRTRK